MSESSEESDDPLYGPDSSLTDGFSSDEYSSGDLRRRYICSGSSSSTGLDSTSSSEPYDEDDSDAEVIKFSSKQKKKDLVGFKTAPRDIETFLKADPLLNGGSIIKGPHDFQYGFNEKFGVNEPAAQNLEWTTSDSSEDDVGGLSYKSRSQVETPQAPLKSNERSITIGFSVQEMTRNAPESTKTDQDQIEKEEDNARNRRASRKPSAAVKKDSEPSVNEGTRSKTKRRSAGGNTNSLSLKGKTEQRLVPDNRKPVPLSTEKRISLRNDKNRTETIQGRRSSRTKIKR
ncbi:hypothetical protein GE061_009672 [Apolygus lucorum]|uniref:Uncharacterized protein n=1 Tax=Apolygus lucorum TaxID=248454 RepID=A0A6A4K744_APOLU|nr:hypothetical protein GE061_009672 [Apolygus lucorum]